MSLIAGITVRCPGFFFNFEMNVVRDRKDGGRAAQSGACLLPSIMEVEQEDQPGQEALSQKLGTKMEAALGKRTQPLQHTVS